MFQKWFKFYHIYIPIYENQVKPTVFAFFFLPSKTYLTSVTLPACIMFFTLTLPSGLITVYTGGAKWVTITDCKRQMIWFTSVEGNGCTGKGHNPVFKYLSPILYFILVATFKQKNLLQVKLILFQAHIQLEEDTI